MVGNRPKLVGTRPLRGQESSLRIETNRIKRQLCRSWGSIDHRQCLVSIQPPWPCHRHALVISIPKSSEPCFGCVFGFYAGLLQVHCVCHLGWPHPLFSFHCRISDKFLSSLCSSLLGVNSQVWGISSCEPKKCNHMVILWYASQNKKNIKKLIKVHGVFPLDLSIGLKLRYWPRMRRKTEGRLALGPVNTFHFFINIATKVSGRGNTRIALKGERFESLPSNNNILMGLLSWETKYHMVVY